MLGTKLELGDVKDVEALCRAALERSGPFRNGARLSSHQYEDALAFLIGKTYELFLRYDPAKDRAREKGLEPRFSDYASEILKRRVVDWYRSEFGDSRYGARPKMVSLDAPVGRGDGDRGRRVDQLVGGYEDDLDVDTLNELAGRGELSEEGSATLREVALPLALGLSKDEVAERLGRSRRHINRCLDELQAEYRALEVRSRMPKTSTAPKVPPTFQPTVQAPSCESCLNHVLEQLEQEGLSRPEARVEAAHKTRMVWVERGKLALCRICNPDVVPSRATRRAAGWRPQKDRNPLRTPEIEARGAEIREREAKRKEERAVRRATERLEQLAAIAGEVRAGLEEAA